jgi:phospholipid/cholesterol/gamma-HCH transport system ATP-binding protein
MSSSNMIVINQLNSHYRGHQALCDVSLTIVKSQVTVIMGVSGCGKTTLLRHLVGLKPTEPGRIFVEGNDLGTFDAQQMQAYRRRVGILFQSGALFNSMTVAENIAVPLKIHSRLADETIRLMAVIKLNMVGLSDFCDFMPSQLSGGMKKRAGLARALAMDPEILFVDEPSSGLDPITAAGLDRLILDLREALGMTIVVVTHELESAFQIADQIIVMDKGCLLAAGTPEEIRQNGDARVIQFLRRQADQGHDGTEQYLSCLLG